MRELRHGCAGRSAVGEAEHARKFADIRLRETGLLERSDDRKLRCSLRTGPKVRRVVGILAIGDGGEAARACQLVKAQEQFRFAE